MDDLRFALRSLLRTPGFTAVAALVLAIGVGAAAMMFVIADAYYFRPAPGVVESARLVNVATTVDGRAGEPMTSADYADLRSWSRSFAGLMAWCPVSVDLGQAGEMRRVPAAVVSSSYFAVLGVRIARGRAFADGEERPSHAHPVAVVSDRLWRTVFADDAGIVGRPISVNGRTFTVVGIAAPGFRGTDATAPVDLWVPLSMSAEAVPEGVTPLDDRLWRWLRVVGRLAPGADLAGARGEAAILSARLRSAGAAQGKPYALVLEPSRKALLRDTYARLLTAGVLALFLAVGANLSSLFLARASARRPEIATRLALGAPRWRIVRRLLIESLLVGLAGGVLGLLVAPTVARGLLDWGSAGQWVNGPDGVYRAGDVAAFVLALSVASGLALGLGPALWVTAANPAATLREGTGGRLPGRSRMRGTLLVGQLACSLVLLSGGGLLLRTVHDLRALLPVPDPGRVLLISVQPSHRGYGTERAATMVAELAARVRRLPGVTSASVSRDAALEDYSFFMDQVGADSAASGAGSAVRPGYNVVAPDYFRTVGTPLLRGRDFSTADDAGAQPVVIVNEALARRLWPGLDPVGRTLWTAGDRAGRQVIGVVRDRPVREGAQPYLFYPLSQRYPFPGSIHTLIVRGRGDALTLVPSVQRTALALGLPLFDPRAVARQEVRNRFFERLAGGILGGAGTLALLLAAIGLYGLMSHWVAMRTHEIGVRMALGADARQVVRAVVWRALRLALSGVGIGLVAALALNRAWLFLLYRARPADPVVLGAASALLVVTSLLAAWLPARRATRVDPVVALRSE